MFSVNRFDAGPVRLASIAHALNYRVTLLQSGIKSAVRIGASVFWMPYLLSMYVRLVPALFLARPEDGNLLLITIYIYVTGSAGPTN